MIVIPPSVSIEPIDPGYLEKLERYGRVAYQSEAKDAVAFVEKLIALGHESVLEHVSVTAIVICDRGVSHELVRHRIASYTQESTRYVRYKEVTFIKPYFCETDLYAIWLDAMQMAESFYRVMIGAGAPPQAARSVLPNSVKTQIVVTMNLRAWRHFFKMRLSKEAHPDMQIVAKLLKEAMHEANITYVT